MFFRSEFFDPLVRTSVVQGKTSAHEGFAQVTQVVFVLSATSDRMI